TAHQKPRRKKQVLKSVLLTSGFSAAMSLVAFGWGVYAHHDSRRAQISDTIWAKRDAAYEKLLEISSQAATKSWTAEEYEGLRQKYYQISGPLELYASHHTVACSIKLRDVLFACANPGANNREKCSVSTLQHLQFRLSAEMRAS